MTTLEPLLLEEKLDACPVCGHKQWGHLFLPDVACCKQCGVIFREPRPTQEAIAASYDSGTTYSEWKADSQRRASLWRRRAKWVQRLRGSGALLDIGVGDGSFLGEMSQAGYEVVGTELSETGAEYARRMGIEVHVGQVTDLTFNDSSFDIVTMWHVLEHVPDPQKVVRRVFRLLRSGGLFIVAVPNEAHTLVRHRLWPARFPRPFGYMVRGTEIHLTHFTPASLKSFLRREGFEILQFGVDDFYPDRGIRARIKFWLQEASAKLIGWHSAVAMQVTCRKA